MLINFNAPIKQTKNIVLLLFNLSIISCYCQGTYFGQYSPCYFYYGFSDINCTVFNFSRCSWSECVAYMRVGNSTVCARTQRFYNSDWGSCTRRCCDSSKSYNYSYNSLQQCEDDQQSKLYLILIIVFSIIGGGIFIFIIILAINKCCYQYQNKNKIESMGQEQQTSSGIVIIKKWKKLQQKQLNNEESCCICLEMGSNCQLQCGHIYHYTCILTWMKINNSCTLCKRTDINKARVYCSRCFEYYYDFLCQQKNKVVHNQICERCL